MGNIHIMICMALFAIAIVWATFFDSRERDRIARSTSFDRGYDRAVDDIIHGGFYYDANGEKHYVSLIRKE